jgi:hypothetical protein
MVERAGTVVVSDVIDYSKDKFQGHWHDLPPGNSGTSSVAGVPRTESEIYHSSSGVMKRCLSCSTDDLKPEYKYCPNCGLLFIC